MNIKLQKEIAAAANKKYELEERIARDIRKLSETVKPMTDYDFWKFVDLLCVELKYYHKTKITNVKSAVHNFFCRCGDVDMITMLSFVEAYEKKVAALYDPLFDVIEGCSDDTYGDILDSFPLYGKARYERALKGQPLATNVNDTVHYNKVFQGENYIQMTLRNAIEERARDFEPDTGYKDNCNYYEVIIHRVSIDEEVMNIKADSPERAEEIADNRIPYSEFNKHIDEKFKITEIKEIK